MAARRCAPYPNGDLDEASRREVAWGVRDEERAGLVRSYGAVPPLMHRS